MSFEVYNADGELIEGVLPPEEAQTLQQQLAETTEKLSKLENKEFNFRKLEQMTEEEKSKLTAAEIALKQKQEELEQQQNEFKQSFVSDIKKDQLDVLAGDDEDLRKKIEYNYSRLKDADTAKTRSEIAQLMNEAYVLSTGKTSTRNPINAAINASGSGSSHRTKSTASDGVIGLAKNFGISEDDINKYSK